MKKYYVLYNPKAKSGSCYDDCKGLSVCLNGETIKNVKGYKVNV